MASNQPGGRRQGQYRGHTASTGASIQSQYRGHTASTGAPDKQTQKGRNKEKQTQKGRNIEKHSPWAVRGARRSPGLQRVMLHSDFFWWRVLFRCNKFRPGDAATTIYRE